MKIIRILFLVFLLLNHHCSDGDEVPKWTVNTNPALIEECLRQSLQHVSFRPAEEINLAEASNIVCETQIDNGILIKITFDFQEHTWQCSLYKSVIQIVNIRFEKCKMLENEELAARIQQLQAAKENEARIDILSKQNSTDIYLNQTVDSFNSSTNGTTRQTILALADGDTDDEIDLDSVPISLTQLDNNQTMNNTENDTSADDYLRSKLGEILRARFVQNLYEMKEEDIEP